MLNRFYTAILLILIISCKSAHFHDGVYEAATILGTVKLEIAGDEFVMENPIHGITRGSAKQYKDRVELGGDNPVILVALENGSLKQNGLIIFEKVNKDSQPILLENTNPTGNANVDSLSMPENIERKAVKTYSSDIGEYSSLVDVPEEEIQQQVQEYEKMESEQSEPSYSSVEVMPEFPGGQNAFGKFLQENIEYPELARSNDIKGKVLISFSVNEDGSLSNFKITKAIGGGCEEEAIRVLKLSPNWKPGLASGKPVSVRYTQSFNFGG